MKIIHIINLVKINLNKARYERFDVTLHLKNRLVNLSGAKSFHLEHVCCLCVEMPALGFGGSGVGV